MIEVSLDQPAKFDFPVMLDWAVTVVMLIINRAGYEWFPQQHLQVRRNDVGQHNTKIVSEEANELFVRLVPNWFAMLTA